MGWKVRSMFNRIWWPDFCHQWILLYFYISNFINHHGSSLLVRFIQEIHGPWVKDRKDFMFLNVFELLFRLNRSLSISHSPRPLAFEPIRNTENMEFLLYMTHGPKLVINKSLSATHMNHSILFKKWLIIFSALGTFALLAETSFLCVCLMDKEWYRNFLERVNFGHFRKAIFYTV